MNFNSITHALRAAQHPVLSACALAALLALAGCGGSSSTTVPQNSLPSPVADSIKDETLVPGANGQAPALPAELEALPLISLNQRQFADPNVLLNLNATVTPAAGATIVTTLWTQVTGPTVRIPSPLQLNNEIIIPDVAAATTLEFRLTAQDSKGKINSATVSILVKPVPYFVKVIGGVFNETDKVAVFTLRLNAASTVPVTFSYNTQDATAINGSDYTLTSGQIIFAAGEISKTISVPLIDDALTEDDETFSLQVTALDGETAHSNSGIAIIHSGAESLLAQTIAFSTAAPPSIKVNAQYTNPLDAGPGLGAVIFTSSNPQIATVDAAGLVTALTPGTVTITATKAGDTTYASATANYLLQVTSADNAPVAAIAGGNISVPQGQTVNLQGGAYDLEDGTFAIDLLDQSQRWNSGLHGFLGYGSEVTFPASIMGWDAITYSVTDSDGNNGIARADIFVGNIAPQAVASLAETTADCNKPAVAINDSNTSTDFVPDCGENYIYLTWPSPVTFNRMDIFLALTPGDDNGVSIEALSSGSGTFVNQPLTQQLVPNIDSYIWVIGFPDTGITTDRLRIATSISTTPATLARIKEISIYNTFDNTLAEPITSASSAIAKSSMASSSAIKSSIASSSTASAATSSSSAPSSSRASSSALSSSRASSSIASAVNIAPLASTKASSTYCRSSDCYSPSKINDGDLSTLLGAMHSWVNDNIEGARWISLTWQGPVTINQVELYTSQGGIIQDYDIEYFDGGESWIPLVSISKNTELHRSHPVKNITTTQLRVAVRNGSVTQSIYGRINELVVLGTTAMATSSVSSSSSSTSAPVLR